MKIEDIIKKSEWYYVNENLNSVNFPIPKKVETEGWKLIEMNRCFTSEEALEKIKSGNFRGANAYELAEWANTHRDSMEKGTAVIALDIKNKFPIIDGDRRVPYVYRSSDGDFGFGLGDFENDWYDDYVLLAFCDSELGTLDTQNKTSDTLILSKNEKVLCEFIAFCKKNPELRFYQSLSAWTGKDIQVGGEDPFYWEGKHE